MRCFLLRDLKRIELTVCKFRSPNLMPIFSHSFSTGIEFYFLAAHLNVSCSCLLGFCLIVFDCDNLC